MNPTQMYSASIDKGKKQKEFHTKRNLSLRSEARRNDLSINTLGMSKRNITSLSVRSINKIADAFAVPMAPFFQENTLIQKIIYETNGGYSHIPFLKGDWECLDRDRFIAKDEHFLLTEKMVCGSGFHYMTHSSNEFGYCLAGQFEYDIEEKNHNLCGFTQGKMPSRLHINTNREKLD